MVAVLDAVGCERVALLGLWSPIGLLFAATHPERTAALVVVDTTARIRRAEDYPAGRSRSPCCIRYLNSRGGWAG